jgi:hypothetical protein
MITSSAPRGTLEAKSLDVDDPMAQDLLAEYARRRRAVDASFSEDLEQALRDKGYVGPKPLTLGGRAFPEPPPGAIRVEMSHLLADGSTETQEYVYITWQSFIDEWVLFDVPGMVKANKTVIRYWREATAAAVVLPPAHEVEEPTTAVESPQAKRASSTPPAQANGPDIEEPLAQLPKLGPDPDGRVLGWHYVCEACLGDEEFKSFGVVACTPSCQCCREPITDRTARPVTATQLARIRKRFALERDIEPREDG